MRADLPIWLVVVTPILGAAFIYFVIRWYSEYCFYRNNKWNFSVENPKRLTIYAGEDEIEHNKMTNKQRIYVGYPLFVFGLGAMFLGFAYCIFRIQTCEHADLKKCGIETSSGSVNIKWQ